jgi:hypothetical protein
LDDAHVKPVVLEDTIDAGPTGAVYEASVDQYDVVNPLSQVKNLLTMMLGATLMLRVSHQRVA